MRRVWTGGVVAAALIVAVGVAMAKRQEQAPYTPKQSDQPTPLSGDEPGDLGAASRPRL